MSPNLYVTHSACKPRVISSIGASSKERENRRLRAEAVCPPLVKRGRTVLHTNETGNMNRLTTATKLAGIHAVTDVTASESMLKIQ